MEKKKYLVTGGTGFIGSALVHRLVQEGHMVRVLDNNLRGIPERLKDIAARIDLINADIRDGASVLEACKDIDCVCHLAYLNGTEFFYSKPDLVLEIGVKGMVNILDGCICNGIRDLVLASSSEVYQTPPVVPTDETVPLSVPDPLNPRYSYGGGKIISELLTINYGRKHFDRAVIFRPHNVYGPDMGWEHVIPQFVLRMKKICTANANSTVEFPIQGAGMETRSFVFIDDFTDGLMKVIEQGLHLGIYHIGTMDEITVSQLAQKVGAFFGKKVVVVPGKAQEGGTPRRCPDITKLRQLGYKPKVSLEDGLRMTARWYDENAHRESNNPMKKG